MRIETQNTAWDIPRPHQDHDGRYWQLAEGDEAIVKLGAVLLGPGTIFYEPFAEGHTMVSLAMRKEKLDEEGWAEEELRTWLAKEFDNVPIRQAKVGEVAIWAAGTDDERAAIHSEPKMNDMPDGRIL